MRGCAFVFHVFQEHKLISQASIASYSDNLIKDTIVGEEKESPPQGYH